MSRARGLGYRLLVRLAAASLAWEALWPRLWPAVTLIGAGFALALLDVLPLLPAWLHAGVLIVFAAALLAALAWAGTGPRQGSQQCCSENNQYTRVQPGGQQRQNVEQGQREAGANERDRWPKPGPQRLPREAGSRKTNEEAIAEAARAAHRPSAWPWPSSAAGASQAGSRCQDNSACQGIRSRTTA